MSRRLVSLYSKAFPRNGNNEINTLYLPQLVTNLSKDSEEDYTIQPFILIQKMKYFPYTAIMVLSILTMYFAFI